MERQLLAEGKTKRVWADLADLDLVVIESKDDLTAGDGAKHDVLSGKAEQATQTTCNVFRHLRASGLESAFLKQLSEVSFLARRCTMIPLEVVVRREAHGSFLKHQPQFSKGQVFPRLVIELYLKTAGRVWQGQPLVVDDPLLQLDTARRARLYRPDRPLTDGAFLELADFSLNLSSSNLRLIQDRARWIFLVLEKSWQLLGQRLVDLKVEFGLTADQQLVLADVIDNDSWRVLDASGQHIDKQVYRDGGALSEVAELYQQVSELTGRFNVPQQSIIFWRGSEADDFKDFERALKRLTRLRENYQVVTCSMHKEPLRGLKELQHRLQQCPDSVIIAYIGRSNGAGPILAAQTHVPVITVPATWREFPADIWSSLRAPSNVPVMTVLEPANAVLAALQILAQHNPALYADLRLRQEERWSD